MVANVTVRQFNVFPIFEAPILPRGTKTERVKFNGNVTSSVQDGSFADFRAQPLNVAQQQQINNWLADLAGATNQHFEQYPLPPTPEQHAQLNNWQFRMAQSADAMDRHFERRYSQLFLQATTVYRTPYTFREGHTWHQGFAAENIGAVKFQGAHGATLPCLYARAEGANAEFVWQYRSGAYDEANATDDVVIAINTADSSLDGNDGVKKLRTKVVELLNRCARGEITPEQVVRQFSFEIINQIDVSLASQTNPEVGAVLASYRQKAQELQWYVSNGDYIDQWLNLQMDHPMLAEITTTVDQLKAHGPVPQERILGIIKQKIDSLPVVIRRELHQYGNECRAPFHFMDLFHFEVFRRFTVQDIPTIEAATGINFAALTAKVNRFQRVAKTNRILAQHSAKIDALVREIQPFIASVQGRQVAPETLTGLSDQRKICLRSNIYRLRYNMIRADQEAQSIIKSHLESVFHSLPSASHLEVYFHWVLLGQAQSDSQRKMLCSLLNISSAELTQAIREIKTNQQAHTALQRYATPISQLAASIQRISKAGPVDPAAKEHLRVCISRLFNQIRSSKNANQLDILFYRRLFDQVESPAGHSLLSELIGSTPAILDQQIAVVQGKKRTVSVVQRTINQNAVRIQQAANFAFTKMRELQQKTLEFRSQLMVELRLSHGMSQDHFKQIYKARFPGFPMSDGTMSHLETGKKAIVGDIVNHLGSIFGVSPTLFYPSTFAEV